MDLPEMDLRRDDRFAGHADDFYESLIAAHHDLSEGESAALNARLILILANEIGDLATLRAAIAAARENVRPTAPDEPSAARR